MSDDSEATWSHVDAPLDDDEEDIASDYSYDGVQTVGLPWISIMRVRAE